MGDVIESSDFYDSFGALSRDVFRHGAPTSDAPFHRLGGHSENVQGDMQLEAQLVTNGLYCGNSTGYMDPRAKELGEACEQWKLLLQLDSDDDADLMWGDTGMLYFWIREEDAHIRNFSKTWMAQQCG